MLRRELLQSAIAWQTLTRPPKPEEAAIASASEDTTPRVGIVLSSFAGSEEHDGSKLKGLARPRPADSDLDDASLDAMVRKAIELGTTRKGGLPALVAPDDWVLILTHTPACNGGVPGEVTDPRVVRSLTAFLAENKLGARITVAAGCGAPAYRKMAGDFTRRYPAVRFESTDLGSDEPVELPVPGRPMAKRNAQGVYRIPKTVQQCDKIVSVAALTTHPRMGVSLAIGNYLGIAGGLDKLGEPDEVAADLFSYHPADYALVGGEWGLETDESGARRGVHHNLVLAGPNAVAVDAAGAAIMGFDPAGIGHLRLAEQSGFGDTTLDIIWLRGNEIEQARRPFRKPRGWRGAAEK
ncbi:MAG: DUF362 domain-containing protein [Acidobacteria bacterium]|nr:DUF362 domain-containing protein [Acidobacteriota bacterium]